MLWLVMAAVMAPASRSPSAHVPIDRMGAWACKAPAAAITGRLPTDRAILSDAGVDFTQPIDTLGTYAVIEATIDSVLAVVPRVYAALGLVVNSEDRPNGRLAMLGATCVNRMGKTPLSVYLDCGSSPTGANADGHRVNLTVVTTVHRTRTGEVRVSNLVLGTSRDMSGASADTQGCSSTGRLEVKLNDEIKKALRQG